MGVQPEPRVRVVAEGFSFLESPRWRNGRLYVSDFYLRKVFSISETGERAIVAEIPGLPSGLGFDRSGGLLVVSMIDRRILLVRPDGRHEVVADLSSLTPHLCNDMHVDPAGRAYVGNFGWDSRVTDEISPTRLIMVPYRGPASVVADGLIFPNGMARYHRGRTLLVAETFAARISAFDIAADGSLSNRSIWADFAGAGRTFRTVREASTADVILPDGIAADAKGGVWVADSGGHAAVLVRAGGAIIDEVRIGPLTPFAVALGGQEGRTLFICAAPPLGGREPDRVFRLEAKLLACEVDIEASQDL
ncbi:MAG: gluconolactonase [Rhodospirillaceae bacterium]|nr:MAG: gluconolactonase [Rhodospirillaceae bacterium]